VVFKDEQAVAMLNGPDTVRDDLLVSLVFEHPNGDLPPNVTMVFESGHGRRTRTATLIFREVVEFAFLYELQRSQVVEMFKCLQTDQGDFYVSLDPYDEREQFVSENDGSFVRSRHIEVTITLPAASPSNA
jgi:hypothetical protein